MVKVFVPTKDEIRRKIFRLSELVEAARGISEIEDELSDELGQLSCDVSNRAGIESGRIADD